MVRLRDAIGLRYLVHLPRHPGTPDGRALELRAEAVASLQR